MKHEEAFPASAELPPKQQFLVALGVCVVSVTQVSSDPAGKSAPKEKVIEGRANELVKSVRELLKSC